MKVKHVYEEILGANIYFVYEYEPEEALKKLKQLKAIAQDETWEGLMFRGSEQGKTIEYLKDDIIRYLVFVKGRRYYTLVHEVIHLVNMIFRWKGIKADFDNDEYYAYYTAHLYSIFEKVLNTSKK